MICVALRHVAFEDLGVFEPVLRRHGYSVEYRQASLEDLSEAEWLEADLAVILGAPIGVYETDKYPWLAKEIGGVTKRLKRDLPTLGICLGAQIMAAALGSRVYPGRAKEIGWGGLDLTEAGRRACTAKLAGAPVLHWHGDTFDLPSGASLLASTEITPHQAFSAGHRGLALQFHPEVDGRAIERWLIGHACELQQAEIDVPLLRAESLRVADAAAEAGARMLEAWLELIRPEF